MAGDTFSPFPGFKKEALNAHPGPVLLVFSKVKACSATTVAVNAHSLQVQCHTRACQNLRNAVSFHTVTARSIAHAKQITVGNGNPQGVATWQLRF